MLSMYNLILLRCLKSPTFDVIEGVLIYFVEPIYVVVIQKRKVSEDQEGSVFLGESEKFSSKPTLIEIWYDSTTAMIDIFMFFKTSAFSSILAG